MNALTITVRGADGTAKAFTFTGHAVITTSGVPLIPRKTRGDR